MITKHTGSTKNKKYTKHTYDTKATCIPRLPTLHRLTSIPRMAIPSDCRIISSTISFPTLAWARQYLLLATISPTAQTSSFTFHFLPLTSHPFLSTHRAQSHVIARSHVTKSGLPTVVRTKRFKKNPRTWCASCASVWTSKDEGSQHLCTIPSIHS